MNVDMQKAGLWKRIAAGILDFILLCILAVGGAYALSTALDYDSYNTTVNQAYATYEQQYGIEFNVDPATYAAMTAEEKATWDEAYQALLADEKAMQAYNMMMQLMLIITTGGILLAVLLVEFIAPLILKNGSTVGKKVFGLGLVRTDCVRVNNLQLFTRALLGKFTIEIMVPVYLVIMIFFGMVGLAGTLVILGILLLQVILYFVTRTNSLLHDLMAGTVVVDVASQRIFASTEERIEYSKRFAAEQAERQQY